MNFFDHVHCRIGFDSEKYDSRQRLFGNDKVTPLWVADMDLASPPAAISAINKRISHPILGYTEKSPALFESICWWMREIHGLYLEPQYIGFSPSVVTTLSMAIETFSEVGSSVCYFSPVYGPFFEKVERAGRNPLAISLKLVSGTYQIDFEKLEKYLKEKDVSLLLFCNPHNPSGRVWSRVEVTKLVSLCRRYGVTIFSDEIHSDLVYEPKFHTSVLAVEGGASCAVVAHSIGKTFNCSGLCSSFWIAPDSKLRGDLRHTFTRFSSDEINLLGKSVIQELYTWRGKNYRRDLLVYLKKNISMVKKSLEPCKGKIEMMIPEGGYLIWLNFSGTGLSHNDIDKMLIDCASLGLTSGRSFGAEGECFFRLNAAVPHMVLVDAVKRLVAAFR